MRTIVLLLCLGLSFGVTAQDKKVWSLKDCMEYAIKNNIQVKQLELNLQDADLNIKDAKGNFLPNLTANARNEWVNSLGSNNNSVGIINNFNAINASILQLRQAVVNDDPSILNQQLDVTRVTGTEERNTTRNFNLGVNSTITIFNGMRNRYNLQQAELQKIANQYNNESLKDDIRLQISNAYLQALLAKANVKVLKSQNEITQQQIQRTELLIDAGNLPKGDVLGLKATSASEQQNIVSAENNYLIALLSLKQQLNLNLMTNIDVQDIDITIKDTGLIGEDISKFVDKVLSYRNEVKFAEQNLSVADKSVDIAKSRLYPTLNGIAGMSSFESDVNTATLGEELKDRFQYNYGLNLSVPIFNRNQTKNAISRAKVAKMRSEITLEQTKQRLTQQVYQAYLDAKASQKSYEAAQIALDAQTTAFDYAKNRFEAGVSNTFEFNQEKLRLQNREIEVVRTKYDLIFRLKLLELYYTGKISES